MPGTIINFPEVTRAEPEKATGSSAWTVNKQRHNILNEIDDVWGTAVTSLDLNTVEGGLGHWSNMISTQIEAIHDLEFADLFGRLASYAFDINTRQQTGTWHWSIATVEQPELRHFCTLQCRPVQADTSHPHLVINQGDPERMRELFMDQAESMTTLPNVLYIASLAHPLGYINGLFQHLPLQSLRGRMDDQLWDVRYVSVDFEIRIMIDFELINSLDHTALAAAIEKGNDNV